MRMIEEVKLKIVETPSSETNEKATIILRNNGVLNKDGSIKEAYIKIEQRF